MHSFDLTKKNEKKDLRDYTLDFFRGIAILSMVFTHVVALTFDHSSSDKAVFWLGTIGGILSFTAFLFISGYSAYLSTLKKFESKNFEVEALSPGKKIIRKEFWLLITYYLLSSFVVVFLEIYNYSFSLELLARKAIDILTFNYLPEFTEFIPALMLFAVSVVLFRRFYSIIIKRFLLVLLVGIAFYIIGFVFLEVDLNNSWLNSIKALFAGHLTANERIHSFPVLQYSFVFLLGMYFARRFSVIDQPIRKIKSIILFALFFLFGSVVSFLLFAQTQNKFFYPLPEEGRFPPSIGFICLSLFLSLAVFLVCLTFSKLLLRYFKAVLFFLSKNSLSFLFYHTLILVIYNFAQNKLGIIGKALSLADILAVFGAVIVLTGVMVISFRRVYTRILNAHIFIARLRNFSYHFFPNLVIAVSFILLIVFSYSAISRNFKNISASGFRKTLIENISSDWWDDSFKVRHQIQVENNTTKDFEENYPQLFTFNHKQALTLGDSVSTTAEDFHILYYNEETGTLNNVNFFVESANSESTKIYFELSAKIITGKKDPNYYFYYGSTSKKVSPTLPKKPEFYNTEGVLLGVGESHKISAKLNRKWGVIKPVTHELYDSINLEIAVPENLTSENYSVVYYIGKNSNGVLMEYLGNNIFSSELVLPENLPATYSVQAKVVDVGNNLEIYNSQELYFNLTFPLYVTWSMDWEGWDVSDYDLNNIVSISGTYGIPIVQLFNPRIYVKEQGDFNPISKERAAYLTNWVINRRLNYGDEIGIHLHMYSDMVKEAGVTVVNDPIIGAAYGDTKTSSYSQEALEKIFKWSLEKFEENNLDFPITYRAGGWQASVGVLNAAENSGIKIDTSGRTGGLINESLSFSSKIPWNLKPTTYPYRPSVGDINLYSGDRMEIWEFPNNGADSYWFSTEDLKSRFNQNITQSKILERAQVVTYLSHPHWFTAVDSVKLRMLFEYIAQFLYSNDSGPVVFSTLERAYNEWDKTLINGD